MVPGDRYPRKSDPGHGNEPCNDGNRSGTGTDGNGDRHFGRDHRPGDGGVSVPGI